MSTAPKLDLLSWDTDFFGIPIARLSGTTLREEDLPAVTSWCRSRDIKCLYFLADPIDRDTLSAAHAGGFKFVDLRVDLELPEAGFAAAVWNAPENVRLAASSDASALQSMARRSHTNTRFFKDARFSSGRAGDLYAEWIDVSLRDPRKTVLVKESVSGQIDGYVACEMAPAGEAGRIGLIAVDVSCRQQGIASELVRAALIWSRSRGARKMDVTTQGDNISGLHLYTSAGFSPTAAAAWFHRWFD